MGSLTFRLSTVVLSVAMPVRIVVSSVRRSFCALVYVLISPFVSCTAFGRVSVLLMMLSSAFVTLAAGGRLSMPSWSCATWEEGEEGERRERKERGG